LAQIIYHWKPFPLVNNINMAATQTCEVEIRLAPSTAVSPCNLVQWWVFEKHIMFTVIFQKMKYNSMEAMQIIMV